MGCATSLRGKSAIPVGGICITSSTLLRLCICAYGLHVAPSFARPVRERESCPQNVTRNSKVLCGSSNFVSSFFLFLFFFYETTTAHLCRSRFSRYRVTRCTLLQLADTHVTLWKKIQSTERARRREKKKPRTWSNSTKVCI